MKAITMHSSRRGGRLARACAAAAALLLAGCASMAPPYETPPLPVAARYPADAPGPATGAHAASVAWRAYFTDPQLQQLITQALESNRDLRITILRVQEARAVYGIQRADSWPTLGLGADASRSRVPRDLSFTGEPLVSSQYQVGLGVNAWELDFWGRVRSLQDAALQNYLATDAGRRAATLLLVAQVADGYLSLRALDERLVLAQHTMATREESLRIFTRRYEAGSTSKFDLTQMRTLLDQAQSLDAQLQRTRAELSHALTLLIGAPADLSPAAGRLEALAFTQPPAAGLPSDLLADRPDIAAAEHRLRAAGANIGAARAAFFPRITLTGNFGTASAELDGLFASGSHAWSFAPSLSLPIFDGGRLQSNLDLNEVRRDIAVADYERSVQTAFREVSDALSAREWLARQVQIQQSTLATQTERARLANLRYRNGATAFIEVLDAQRDLLEVEQQLVQTRRALLSADVSLYTALGGGSRELAAAAPSADRAVP